MGRSWEEVGVEREFGVVGGGAVDWTRKKEEMHGGGRNVHGYIYLTYFRLEKESEEESSR